jgi:hypothetical protein
LGGVGIISHTSKATPVTPFRGGPSDGASDVDSEIVPRRFQKRAIILRGFAHVGKTSLPALLAAMLAEALELHQIETNRTASVPP